MTNERLNDEDSLYIVMPAYNEEQNIESVVRQWYPILEGKGNDSKFVIADSGSSDRTHAILLELQKEFPKLHILENTGKQHGPKLMALYDYVINLGGDYIFQTDSDGQTDPTEFEAFWDMRKEYDGIFGHRNVREDGKDRAFVEKVVCILLHLYFGIRVPDANAPFRLMKTRVVEKYLYKMDMDYNLPNIMLVTYFVHYKEKVCFKTIRFKERQGGENSINIVNIVKIGWKALGDFKRLKRDL